MIHSTTIPVKTQNSQKLAILTNENNCLNEGMRSYFQEAELPACICKRVYGGKDVTSTCGTIEKKF